MNIAGARSNLHKVIPRVLRKAVFVRAYNTWMITAFHRKHLFDSTWSYKRGYRYNFKETYPVFYFAGDQLVASTEIGPRTYDEGGNVGASEPTITLFKAPSFFMRTKALCILSPKSLPS